jgi:hypothetical protein
MAPQQDLGTQLIGGSQGIVGTYIGFLAAMAVVLMALSVVVRSLGKLPG